MKTIKKLLIFSLVITHLSCISKKNTASLNDDFTIAFGSCNKQYKENILWKEILKNNPNLWIWGGDNVYADTDNMSVLKEAYHTLSQQKEYEKIVQKIPIMATWDDHDYGFNDSGKEFYMKAGAQSAFLDFFKVPKNSSRRKQKGIYNSKVFETQKGSVKVIVLDTRYFRDSLTKSSSTKKRFIPNTNKESTILGTAQWNWLTEELNNSKANFNIIVSSIQILAAEHGFETWGNFPHEVQKLTEIIKNSNAKGVLLLSGDRHISEFSRTNIKGVNYPIIDFTSSGLTHSYSGFTSEPNKYRVQNVISEISFGLLKFNFEKNNITMQMRGKNNKVLQELVQQYPKNEYLE